MTCAIILTFIEVSERITLWKRERFSNSPIMVVAALFFAILGGIAAGLVGSYVFRSRVNIAEILENASDMNADKHSPASSARSTKRWVRGMLMSVRVESSH